ncbi:hypothetical protein [Leifsonia xyli]|uniref:hypothetical protein n=1 Tax=Leifsonia xyli TaxID=1575 RepID=UPI003D67B5B4
MVATEGAARLPLAELRRAVAGRLGRAAAPDRVVELERMPRLASGKPDRVAVAALAADDAGDVGDGDGDGDGDEGA